MGLITQREMGLSRLAMKNEFMSQEQVDDCFDIIRQRREEGGEPVRFDDLAVEQGFMTSEQASAVAVAFQRHKKDAEKRKWAISGYDIFSKIGEGGLGVVFKARQISMNRIVALKILHRRWTGDEEFKKRFLVEARLVGKLSHQNLIKVFDVGKEDWKYYFSMEYVQGETLDDLIERDGPLDAGVSVDITLQILRAIRYIAQFEIVHCDIKPSNVMMTKEGVCKLGDFGFVRTNIEIKPAVGGTVLGTPDYISPEQAMGRDDIDFKADIYSLGVTLYHMVTKRPPFEGTVSTIMRKHIKQTAPSPKALNPELSDELVRIINKMMAKDPVERYQSFESLFEDLEAVKISEKAGSEIASADRQQLVSVLEKEKDRRIDTEAHAHDLQTRLDRVEIFVKLLGGLLVTMVLVAFLLLWMVLGK